MKRLLLLIFTAFAFSSFGWAASGTIPIAFDNTKVVKEKKLSDKDVKVLLDRLNEIQKMNKSNLTREQKKELRTEVKAIKSKLDGGYVYISGTAILIIILLILLL